MANRPIFLPGFEGVSFVETRSIEFVWFPGMARSQKQKSIRSLYDAASAELGITKILEISSKSGTELGVQLSAFNLTFVTPDGATASIESLFQGSKVFQHGGPYSDLYGKPPRDAKKDSRLKASGELIHFQYGGKKWELEPKTAFYDWLFISGLVLYPALASQVLDYEGFTDIEFNPKKSINCQAASAALYCALASRALLEQSLSTPEQFLETHQLQKNTSESSQVSLFAAT